MKNTVKTLCFVLILSLMYSGCGKDEPDQPQDLESLRANLREKVESDELTKEEAIVKLAEAEAKPDWGDKDKYEGDKDKYEGSADLKELGEKLKELVDKGELTEEQAEAKAAWIKAAEETKDKSGTK
jgi:hypothetical protein